MKKKIYVLYAIFVFLFIGSIAVGLIGRAICVRDTQNYWELQPELFAPDEIATVLSDDEQEMLYVCYNDASYVNVYSYSGEFLWAVSTPYLRNVYFELQEEHLIIYNGDEAYIYNSTDGRFIECVNAEDLTLEYDWGTEQTDEIQQGEFYFDTYQVYKGTSDGTLETFIARPWWYWCFSLGVFVGALIGAFGIGITIFLEKRKEYNLVKKEVTLKNRKQKVMYHYFRITSAVQIVYAVLNIVFGFFGGILCIGLIPIGIHFIVSSIILHNMLDRMSAAEDEMTVLNYWRLVELFSFLIAFFSVVAVALIFGQ